MELIILILGASALAGCLGGSLYIYERVQRRPFQENERLLALWARLAAASDQLEFVPSLYKRTHGQNSYLVGTYRGHQLKLDTFYRSETKDYTTRQGRYRHMRCVVSDRSNLSDIVFECCGVPLGKSNLFHHKGIF